MDTQTDGIHISTPGVVVQTPTCDRLSEIAPESQKLGEFLDWLREQGIHLAAYHAHTKDCREPGSRYHTCGFTDQLVSVQRPTEELLADYFEVDLAAVETERRALLTALAASHRPPKVVNPHPYKYED